MSDETGGYLVAHPTNRVCGLVHPSYGLTLLIPFNTGIITGAITTYYLVN